uniref:DUF4460 domain-containing protein n=1 Tax=Corethron hystrix TaxID=216773 RepID=A0A7S1BW80_9STRA|mmetsp:Transcript_41131/g.96508  ORF Transcript_41131/g.96508 Transcript_41131/m.96508 type:complete len:425 (+) Transcript_41131:115-1389(+)
MIVNKPPYKCLSVFGSFTAATNGRIVGHNRTLFAVISGVSNFEDIHHFRSIAPCLVRPQYRLLSSFREVTPLKLFQKRFLSSNAGESTVADARHPRNLRAAIRPFVKLIHPDRYGDNDSARKTNAAALQTLNSMMDGLEEVISSDGAGIRPSSGLGRRYEIEFVVPTGGDRRSSSAADTTTETVTRRSIVLTFDVAVRPDQLRVRGRREISRLLKVAGLMSSEETEGWDREHGTLHGYIPKNEDGERGRGYGGDRFERNRLQREHKDRLRREYNVDWREEKRKHAKAVAAMERDLETLGICTEDMARDAVADLIGKRVKFFGTFDNIEKWMILRRLSMILEDYCDFLRMEDHAKMWGSLIITICNNSMYKRGRRSKLTYESGFKFSWDEHGILTVYIPHDFKDWEFLDEFNQNIPDYNIMEEKF